VKLSKGTFAVVDDVCYSYDLHRLQIYGWERQAAEIGASNYGSFLLFLDTNTGELKYHGAVVDNVSPGALPGEFDRIAKRATDLVVSKSVEPEVVQPDVQNPVVNVDSRRKK
jgi:hypothetical protein